MVLVREYQQLGRYAFHACRIEGSEALVGVYAIVKLSVDAQYRCVPFVNETVGRVVVCSLGALCLVLVPECVVILPVREPHLLCVCIH